MTTANEVIQWCGDGSCILRDRSKPMGMHTNGGCQHLQLSPHDTRVLLRSMAMELDAQRAEIARLTVCLTRANDNMANAERELYLKLDAVEGERDELQSELDALRANVSSMLP